MEKILLTGASGFIGTHLLHRMIEKCGAEHIVLLASKTVSGVKTVLHKGYQYDARELADALGSKYRILHLGAVTPKTSEDYNRTDLFMENIRTTRYLLSHLTYIPQRILYASSIDVYDRSGDAVIDENSRIQTDNAYGLSKYLSEMLVKEYCQENDVAYSIGRIGNIYGPGEFEYSKIIGSFIRKCANNEDIVLYDGGKSVRNLFFIDDLCEALIELLDVSDNTTVNLVSAYDYTTKEIADAVMKVIETQSKIVIENRIKGRKDLFVSTRRSRIIPFAETTLETGIEKTWQDYQRIIGTQTTD